MSEIKSRLLDAVKVAMRAQDKPRLTTLRLALADIKRVEVDERIEVDDARVLLILDRMIKQRRDAQRQFSDAGRQDLAEVEAAEILVLQDFMPKPLDDHEIDALIERSIVDSGAQGPQDMGKAMNLLRPQVQGRVDMAQVSQRLKARLSS
ncbi:GatB/YqeY domain-containing protein [Pseudomonas aeruginosa]|nr:GatB/YqeY domain-containing protein [Pseudomonas aeruginosa]TED64474.1 GatB/YqeY domain-containing protein [Pseudomonas aeruginosa]HBO3681811.1 GatB/YqeY domain-containing protein [Pseudomonas aeruginosa]HBO3971213.1 GatB/YqeY domain-containing protein [Pseudomonas aeruginosa]HDQ4568496.1 GatB/YqeY domain-containing protein [Pseudomonas aeruginosa]